MSKSLRTWFVLGMVAVGLVACGKKEEEPQAVPIPSAAEPVKADPPTQQAASPNPPTPADSGSAAAAGAAAPPAAASPSPAAPTQPARQESVDACCSALAAVKKSGMPAAYKTKAATAAAVCSGVAKAVKSGATSRATGLTQIRSAFGGEKAPAECF